jgi:hypothetical protein
MFRFRRPSHSGHSAGFDFTFHMRRLCEDVAARLPEMGHIDVGRVAICFAQARKAVRHGLYATLTPLRFEGGTLVQRRRRRNYAIQRVYDDAGREMLYVLKFYLPRFLDTSFEEKLTTVFHELWHISPDFDGDLRRHEGRCYAHTASQKEYDAAMTHLWRRWLALAPPENLYGFLRLRFPELEQRYGAIYGMKMPHPKLLPVE